MRFEVPQFIEIEDKIFGPFTWKQFVYLCGGVGLAVVFFITLPFIAFFIIGVPVAGLAALLAFYPINNRPFSIFLESMFTFYSGNNNYRWKKERQSVYRETTNAEPAHTVPNFTNAGINNLARKLELKAIQKDS